MEDLKSLVFKSIFKIFCSMDLEFLGICQVGDLSRQSQTRKVSFVLNRFSG